MRVASLLVPAIVVAASPSAAPVEQVEVDRTLQRVHGTPIMASDVRQAKALRLAGPSADTDEAVLTALENRLLMLREVARAKLEQPSPDLIASRRRTWESVLGPNAAGALQRAGMSDKELHGWFRDDSLIDAYIDQRFGPASDPRRAARVADWIRDLRHRANLGK